MLTITPINFSGIRNLPKTSFKNATLPKIGQDSFLKTNNISFKGADFGFIKWMKENNVSLPDIQAMICDENLIGSGNYNSAFLIPNSDDYVLRVVSSDIEAIKNADMSKAQLKLKEGDFDINIGQKVAAVEIPTIFPIPTEIQILKKQTGEAIGVQPPETIKDGELSYEDGTRKDKYARTIHKVAKLPLEAYEKLLSDYIKADKAGYRLDYLNSNNLLVDNERGQINLIDMERYGVSENYFGLLYDLTNAQYYRTYCDRYYMPVSDDERNQATQDTIEIIRKFMCAMKNQGLKFNRNNIPYEANKDLIASFPCWMALGARNEYEVWEKLSQMGLVK